MPAKDKLLHFLWLFFFAVLPLFKAFSSVAEVALILVTLYRFDVQAFKTSLRQYRHVILPALFFCILIAGLLYTENLSNGWRYLRHQHRLFVIPLLFIANAGLIRKHFHTYLGTFCRAAAAACAIVVVLYLLPADTVRGLANSTSLMLDYPENKSAEAFGLYSPFIDRIQLSSLLALAILSCCYLLSINWKRWQQLLLLPLLLFTMLILGGRGGQLALLLSLLFYALAFGFSTVFPILSKKTGKPAAFALLIAVFLLLFGGGPWLSYKLLKPVQARVSQTQWELEQYKSGEFIHHDYAHFTTLRRMASWQNMWEVVKQNPIIGTGTGDYRAALEKAYTNDTVQMQLHIHNQYLMIWGMSGIIGLLFFLFMLLYWFRQMSGYRKLSYFASAFLLFYGLNMMPDAVLNTQVDSMAFCSFFALIGLQRPGKHTEPSQTEH